MTTTVTTAETGPLTANGTTPLPFTFQALSANEITVTRNGVSVSPVTYSVTLNSDSTGTVTPLASWGSDTVYIYSEPDYSQPAQFERYIPAYPDLFNAPLDRLSRTLIALKRRVDRSANGEGILRSDLALATGGNLIGLAGGQSLPSRLEALGVSPKSYGAVGNGTTNDLAAINAAFTYAFANGLPVDGGDAIYAIDGGLTVTAKTAPWIKSLRLKQLTPSSSRRSLYFNTCQRIRIDQLEVDVGTNKVLGYMNDSAGLWIEGGSNHRAQNVTAFGHGKNSLITVMSTSDSFYSNFRVRDAEFSDAAATDDVMQGIFLLYNTDCVFANFRVSNLTGNALFGGVPYANLRTRGISMSGNVRCDLVNPRVRDIDQGIDISGGEGNRQCNIIGGHAFQCTTAGLKLANSAVQCKATGFISERCGTHGFLVSGPAASGLTYKTSLNEFIGCTAIDIGYNGFAGGGKVGFGVEANAFDTSYPKGNRFIGCRAIDTQAVTFTSARLTGETSGTLTAAWTGATGARFARFDNGETRTVTLTNSSTAVTWTGGLATSAGTALALPTMQYGYYSNTPFDADKRPNELIDFKSEGHTVAAQFGDHRPVCRVNGTGTVSLTNGVELAIGWDAEVEDTMLMHSTSSNTDQITVPIAGTYRVKAKLTFAANSSGYRRAKITKNGVSITYNTAAPVSGEITTLMLEEVMDLAAGDFLKVLAEQTSGGALTVSRNLSFFEVELVRAA